MPVYFELNIMRKWRTSEFSESDEDSVLTIRLKKVEDGTEVHLIHRNIPSGQTQYLQGWKDHYFDPMKIYFSYAKIAR